MLLWYHEWVLAHVCVFLSYCHMWIGVAAGGRVPRDLTHTQPPPPHLPHNGPDTAATPLFSVPKVLSFEERGQCGIVLRVAFGFSTQRTAPICPDRACVSACSLFAVEQDSAEWVRHGRMIGCRSEGVFVVSRFCCYEYRC